MAKKKKKKKPQTQKPKNTAKETNSMTATVVIAAVIIVLVIALVVLIIVFLGGKSTDVQGSSSVTEVSIDKSETYYADIDIKDYGKITVKLDPGAAPETVKNFVTLANEKFYDGLTFHRIIEGFMMQGGDPNGNGNGGSDKTIVGEFSANGYDNPLSHTRGAISMARATDPDSASSQFFIVHKDSTFLDGNYAVFGYVTDGMDVVDKVCEDAEPVDDNGTIPADAQPIINSIRIRTEETSE